jgi:hypothetical protein
MNEEQRVKIEQLAEIAFDAAEKVRGMDMMNVHMESGARKKQAIEYAIAKAEMNEANNAMETFLNADLNSLWHTAQAGKGG